LHGKIEQQLFLYNLDSHLQPMGVLVCVHWLQKTFPVVVAVVSKLGGAIGETGLLVLPCITYHLTQVILQALVISGAQPKGGFIELCSVLLEPM
jgi:hypothetical protein